MLNKKKILSYYIYQFAFLCMHCNRCYKIIVTCAVKPPCHEKTR